MAYGDRDEEDQKWMDFCDERDELNSLDIPLPEWLQKMGNLLDKYGYSRNV